MKSSALVLPKSRLEGRPVPLLNMGEQGSALEFRARGALLRGRTRLWPCEIKLRTGFQTLAPLPCRVPLKSPELEIRGAKMDAIASLGSDNTRQVDVSLRSGSFRRCTAKAQRFALR